MIVSMKAPAIISSLTAAAVVHAETALAAIPDAPDQIPPANQPGAWQSWLIAIVIFAAAGMICMKRSKRTHLD